MIGSRTWVISEIPQQPTIQPPERVRNQAHRTQPDPPGVVTQHTDPSARFVLLSSQVMLTPKHYHLFYNIDISDWLMT